MNEALLFLSLTVLISITGYFLVSKFHVSGPRKFELLVSYFGGISVLLVIYNIYINIQSNDRIEKNRTSYNTIENIQKNYLNPQRELLDLYPESYFLYASMNQDTDMRDYSPKSYHPLERKEVELYGSLRVFQAIEDFLSTAEYDITGHYVWINSFLMWLQSPILQHYWTILNFNYADSTKKFINQLIEKANALVALREEKGALVADDYQSISKNMKIE